MVRAIVLEVDASHAPFAAADASPFAHVVVGLLVPPKAHGALLVEVPVWDRPLDRQQGSLIR